MSTATTSNGHAETNGQAATVPTPDEMLGWFTAILEPGQTVELRAIGGKTYSRIYRESDLPEMIRDALDRSASSEGVYWTLNPLKSETDRSAKKANVLRRRLFLVDIDPARPGSVSATDAEKSAAVKVVRAVKAYLKAEGWPDPIVADSGNGRHLLYLIDLPTDDQDLVKRCLAALAEKFDTETATVDRKVFDAPRITKFYGTTARKGEPTDERPHRASRVLMIPGGWASRPVAGEFLEALADSLLMTAKSSTSTTPPPRNRTANGQWTPEARAVAYLEKCDPAISGHGGHGQTFKAACKVGPGFDLDPETAFSLIRDYYNPRCDPKWSETELRHKVNDAYEVETRRGWLLTADRDGYHQNNGSARPSANGQTETGPTRGVPNEAEDDPHRLARVYRDQFCSRPDGLTLRYYQGEWLRWDGAYRSAMDKDVRAEMAGVIKGEFDRINIDAIASNSNDKPPKARKVTGALVGNVSLALASYTRLAGPISHPAWLDGDAPFPATDVLPTRNALVHLPSLVEGRAATHPPTPRFFCPYVLDYDFDPNALDPVNWLTFLGSRPITPNGAVQLQLWPDDPQSISTLQEWMGLNLVPDTRYQKIAAMIGPKRSGKGTIARMMTALVGEANVANPTLASLGTNFGLAPLIGKLACIIADARLSYRADIAQIVENLLNVSGEDNKTIDRKHMVSWTGRLATRFTLISNEIPRLSESSGALAGRMVILRLTRSFYGHEDQALMEKLLPELPGILLWAIEGWDRLRKRGYFIQPEMASQLVEELEDLSSPVGMFIKECCEVGSGHQVKVPDLFARWKSWCQEKNREQVGDESSFGRNLRSVIPNLTTKVVKRAGTFFRVFEGVDIRSVNDF